MISKAIYTVFFCSFLLSCEKKTTNSTEKPVVNKPLEDNSTTVESKEPPRPEFSIGSPFIGYWSSPNCDKRTYQRILDIKKDGQFIGYDEVSPCPKNKKCYWSGIVITKGAWKPKGDTIVLSVDSQTPKKGANFPASLQWSNKEGAKGPSEGEACLYRTAQRKSDLE